LLWLPLLCLLWVAGPIMGYCWHWPRSAPAGKGIHLRVMTYNIKGGRRNPDSIVRDLQRFHPDVVQMQDSQGVMNGPVGKAFSGWYISASGQYIIVSRFPIGDADGRNISFPGSAHHCVRSTLMVEGKPLTIYNVHLLSPRYGLIAIKYHHVSGIEQNTVDRMFEAKMLVDALRAEKGPLILTGDLNAPVQSQVCQQLFATGLRDAYSDAGWGYGYSYGQTTRVRVPYVRIDHILVNEAWQVERCMVGNSEGSDHSPVIADLFLAQ
jgi:endonuclease/exonuclease/phosphatase (EEP) superfamily protein YafD